MVVVGEGTKDMEEVNGEDREDMGVDKVEDLTVVNGVVMEVMVEVWEEAMEVVMEAMGVMEEIAVMEEEWEAKVGECMEKRMKPNGTLSNAASPVRGCLKSRNTSERHTA